MAIRLKTDTDITLIDGTVIGLISTPLATSREALKVAKQSLLLAQLSYDNNKRQLEISEEMLKIEKAKQERG